MRDQNAGLKVVVSPLFDQQKLAPGDLGTLRKAFGPAHVHDYSGVNAITADRRNYYESSHYRKTIGDGIIDDLYCANETRSATATPAGAP